MLIDPDGRRIVFSNRDDAALFHNNVNSIFPGAKFDDFKSLLTRGGKYNKLAFDKIDNTTLEASITNLNNKEQHLAKMYASAINDKRDITVKYYSNTDKIEGQDYERLYSAFTDNGKKKDAVTLANAMRKSSVTFDQDGRPTTTYYFTGDVLNVRDGGISIQDGKNALIFLNKESANLDVKSGHEVIGHGLPLIKGGYTKEQNDDHAVQTENLIRDVSGKGGQIDGTQHNDQRRPTSNPNDLPK